MHPKKQLLIATLEGSGSKKKEVIFLTQALLNVLQDERKVLKVRLTKCHFM